MTAFALNILLMLFWLIVTANFTASNILLGFIASWGVLLLIRPFYKQTFYFRKPFDIIHLFAIFIFQLFAASIQVVWDVLTPEHKSKPGIIAVPLDVRTETQILLLTSFISLTPGTLTLDLSKDKKTLYIHCMFVHDRKTIIKDIKHGIERLIIRVTKA